jgi:hypothetical protein
MKYSVKVYFILVLFIFNAGSASAASIKMTPSVNQEITFDCKEINATFDLKFTGDIVIEYVGSNMHLMLSTSPSKASEALAPSALLVNTNGSKEIKLTPSKKHAFDEGFAITWIDGSYGASKVSIEMTWNAVVGEPRDGNYNGFINFQTGYSAKTRVDCVYVNLEN